MTPLAHVASAAPLFAGLLFAAVEDLRSRRVGNLLNATLALGGMTMWTLFAGGRGLLLSAGGLLACLAIGILPFARGWLGGGDVKLLAAVGAWVGLALVPMLLLLTAVAGGAVSLGTLAYAGRSSLRQLGEPTTRPRAAQVPYALAIAAGATLTVLMGGK